MSKGANGEPVPEDLVVEVPAVLHRICSETPFHASFGAFAIAARQQPKGTLGSGAVSHARARGGILVSRGETGESLEVVNKLAEFSYRQSFPGPLGIKPDF